MPSWKKVIVSGSSVHLAEITASGEIKTPSVSSTRTPNSPASTPCVISMPSKSRKLRDNVSLLIWNQH